MHTTSQRLRYRFWLRVWEIFNGVSRVVLCLADDRMNDLEFTPYLESPLASLRPSSLYYYRRVARSQRDAARIVTQRRDKRSKKPATAVSALLTIADAFKALTNSFGRL